MDKHRLILPMSILLGCIILGGFYYASETNKQLYIEKKQEMKLSEDQKLAEAQMEQTNQNQLALQSCLDEADAKYNKSAKYWLDLQDKIGADNVIKSVEKEKVTLQQDKDNCYKQYK